MRYALLLAAALMVAAVATVPHEVARAAQNEAAALKTVTLDVKMFCGSCPYIVRKSLETVPGVAEAKADYDTQTATVTFDPQKTNVQALTEATANAGFPSTLKKD
jgi:mercuric ion binding protein